MTRAQVNIRRICPIANREQTEETRDLAIQGSEGDGESARSDTVGFGPKFIAAKVQLFDYPFGQLAYIRL